MGYSISSAGLKDGRVVQRVVIVGGVVTRCDHSEHIAFGDDDIEWIKTTHDKSALDELNPTD
jgi:hypothetical protein